MEWYLLETLISPETNTSFSLIVNVRNVHRIVWHMYDADLIPGKHILLNKGKIMFKGNKKVNLISVLNNLFYSETLWTALKAYTGCEKHIKEDHCTYVKRCAIKTCPRQYQQNDIIKCKDKSSGLH